MEDTLDDLLALDLDLNLDASPELTAEVHVSELPSVPRVSTKKKTISNAEKCRRHRVRKREQEKQVYVDNAWLKEEKQSLEEKLSDLQNEIQILRGQGVMDLSKENRLLRAEIARHKEYLERVVAVALGTPLDIGQLETRRLMESGVESAISQVVGLAYSSINNPTWQQVATMKFPSTEHLNKEFPGLEEVDVEMLYQNLPFDAPTDKVVRINFRSDVIGLPISIDDLYELYWKYRSDTKAMNDIHIHDFCGNGRYREVYPVTKLSQTEDVACTEFQITIDGTTKKVVFASGRKEVEMFSMAFLDDGAEGSSNNVKIIVSTCSNVPTQNCKEVEEVEKFTAMSVDGVIFRDCGNGRTSLSFIDSDPTRGGFADTFLPDAEQLLNSKGELNSNNRQSIKLQSLNAILKRHANKKQLRK